MTARRNGTGRGDHRRGVVPAGGHASSVVLIRPDSAVLDPWYLAGMLSNSDSGRQAARMASTLGDTTRFDPRRVRIPVLPIEDQRTHGAAFRCIHGHGDLLNQQIGHVLGPPAGCGPCPSVGKPAVAPTARRARTPSAMRPWLASPARRRPVDHADIKRTHACTAILAAVVYPARTKY